MSNVPLRATAREMQVVRAVPSTTASSSIVLSRPGPADLVIYRGDSGRFRVNVTDPAGNPLDVSGATWSCQIRETADSTEGEDFTVTPVQGDPSSIDVILDAATSARIDYTAAVWDLQMSIGGEVQTLLAGKCVVTKDVSRLGLP